MREDLLEYLACPNCGGESLGLDISKKDGPEIISGTLTCKDCYSRFQVLGGIPSMLPEIYENREKFPKNLSPESSVKDIQKSEMLFRDNHVAVYDSISLAQAQLEIDYVLSGLALPPTKGSVVLDLGCGTGRALLPLIPYAKTIIGVDFSLESLKLLRAKLKELGAPQGVHLIHADVEHTPLKSKLFDAVACVQLLSSVPDLETRLAVLKQACRVARPGAHFVLSVFYYSLLKQIRSGFIVDPLQDVYEREGLHLNSLYYHNFTGAEIRELLIFSNFKVLQMHGVNTPLTRRYGAIGARIEKLLKWSGILTQFSHWITVSAIVKEVEDEI